eukprot:scaffold146_cov107-Cylindrotheca_fusiformis.AAC.3
MMTTTTVVVIPFRESEPLQTHSVSWNDKVDTFPTDVKNLIDDDDDDQQDYLETPLIRPRDGIAGLYAYFNTTTTDHRGSLQERSKNENIRATRLAMACGLLSRRFYGNVLLVRGFGGRWEDLSVDSIQGAACISPDLRECIQKDVAASQTTTEEWSGMKLTTPIPTWLGDAAQNNYHDNAALALVAKAMDAGWNEDSDSDEEGSSSSSMDANDTPATLPSAANQPSTEFVAKSPLCLHCRSSASTLCPDCEGAYFCSDKSCRTTGWSHSCLCPTWKVYTSHRTDLSSFSFFGEWQTKLTDREFQTQEEPYARFLQSLGIDDECTSWWTTETYGWAGGQSRSAKKVDTSVRKSYLEGFSPIVDTPPERRITVEDIDRPGSAKQKNSVGMIELSSWMEYYILRGIPPSSPVSILCTFPLTVYYSILRFGEVPVTVARMLKRPLRVHVVGAEKELNFLDLFKEVSFLLPVDLALELVFVVRQDMLPPSCHKTENGTSAGLELTAGLSIYLVDGTYGDSLDPRFDCGSGPPDMVLALNAGLYAYESWRSVVSYLYENSGVVGVFSDYNEYSGVNCAAMGGAKSRESLMINPFRQPLAMPVYSMNLPQFSNGFLYAFNQQELE